MMKSMEKKTTNSIKGSRISTGTVPGMERSYGGQSKHDNSGLPKPF